MSQTCETDHCGKPATVLGFCAVCFAQFTDTFQTTSKLSQEGSSLRPEMQLDGGKFTLIRKLGEGGMGEVWLAEDNHLSKSGAPVEVALKFVSGGGAKDPELESLLREEVRAVREISHPNIVRVYSWHPGNEYSFYCMEYMPGVDLRKHLDAQPTKRFSFRDLEPLVAQMVAAIAFVHRRGLVHRDLKPGNMLIGRDGTLRLADFGIARRHTLGEVETTGAAGTLLYAAPQQLWSTAAPSPLDDIYSLGALLYHLLTGSPPYSVDEIKSGPPGYAPPHPWSVLGQRDQQAIPPEVAEAILRCLCFDPLERPPDVETFWDWCRFGIPPETTETESNTSVISWLIRGASTLGYTMVLALLFVAAWKLGVKSVFWRNVPELAANLENFGENLPAKLGFGLPVSKVSVDIERKPGESIPAVFEVKQFEAAIFAGVSEPIRYGDEVKPIWKSVLRSDRPSALTNLLYGTYTLEVGLSKVLGDRKWCRIVFHVDSSNPTLIPVDFVPQQVTVDLDSPVGGSLLDGWGKDLGSLPASSDKVSPTETRGVNRWRFWDQALLPGDYQVKVENVKAPGNPIATNIHVIPGKAMSVFMSVPSKRQLGTLRLILTNAPGAQLTFNSGAVASLFPNRITESFPLERDDVPPGGYWVEVGGVNDFKDHSNAIRTHVDIKPSTKTELIFNLKPVRFELWLSASQVAFKLNSPFGAPLPPQPERLLGGAGKWYSVVTRDIMEGVYDFQIIANSQGREYYKSFSSNIVVKHGMELPVKITVEHK